MSVQLRSRNQTAVSSEPSGRERVSLSIPVILQAAAAWSGNQQLLLAVCLKRDNRWHGTCFLKIIEKSEY
jgi:hypothetical protein